MGPLTVFKEAIGSLAEAHSDKYEIIALVHRTCLFDISGATLVEYPRIKKSWFRRLRFEYLDCRRISKEIKPHLWFAMHDMTPCVSANIKVVYCHNPSPFYRFRIKDALLDWKFGLFTLFYRFLYRINIKSNDFVVVQQKWMRSEFLRRYGVRNVVVAHPSVEYLPISPPQDSQRLPYRPYRFFYPAYPRLFKNIEQVLGAARKLESSGFNQFEVWLTMNGTETPYAARVFREFSNLATVKWLGIMPRSEVMRRYGEADCLVFPSKLETWGMPITEFKATGKPILAADLPYSHETVGEYGQAAFFAIGDVSGLADMMGKAAAGDAVFGSVDDPLPGPPYARNWYELWDILLQ
jgi:glycosyltransferase involved in cell wall biosynthesis